MGHIYTSDALVVEQIALLYLRQGQHLDPVCPEEVIAQRTGRAERTHGAVQTYLLAVARGFPIGSNPGSSCPTIRLGLARQTRSAAVACMGAPL